MNVLKIAAIMAAILAAHAAHAGIGRLDKWGCHPDHDGAEGRHFHHEGTSAKAGTCHVYGNRQYRRVEVIDVTESLGLCSTQRNRETLPVLSVSSPMCQVMLDLYRECLKDKRWEGRFCIIERDDAALVCDGLPKRRWSP